MVLFFGGENMPRKLEKISFEQFKKDICQEKKIYESYHLPMRKTKYSAGYDFEVIMPFTLKPGEIKKVPTGIKVLMESDDMFCLIIRSSMGFKYNVRMCNQIGVIDADYYNNKENEGHMYYAIQNEGTETLHFETGDTICQGIFMKYGITDDDISSQTTRKGGLGSTTKER